MSSEVTSTGSPEPPQPRTIVLRNTDGTSDLQTRLLNLGFKLIPPLTFVNSDGQANIQQITLARDSIDARKWEGLIVQARKPDHIEEDLLTLGVCEADDIVTDQQTQEELERDMRLNARYYKETIQPYLNDPMRDLIEWYVAEHAYDWLQDAIEKARNWNRWTKQGQQFPVPKDAFPDLGTEGLRVPELIGDKEDLEQQLRALPPPPGSSPAEALNWAIEYNLKLEAHLKSLPKKPVDLLDKYDLSMCPITFERVIKSNETEGYLPLLPTVPGEPDQLSVQRAKQIALDWQKLRRAPLSDYLERDQIPLMYLCELRRERFRVHGNVRPKIPPLTQLPSAEPTTHGRLKCDNDFKDIWIGGDHYDLRTRLKARACIQYLVLQKAFHQRYARHLKDEIDPFVREKAGNLPPAADIRIQHYFTDTKNSRKRLKALCEKLVRVVRGTGRYYLNIE